MPRIKYEDANDVKSLAKEIISVLADYFSHIDMSRVFFIRSKGARTSAIARIHALPGVWRSVLKLKPMYIIEVVSENFDRLSESEKAKVIIHELLHIPRGFSGGLRPHGKIVNSRNVSSLYRLYLKRVKDR